MTGAKCTTTLDLWLSVSLLVLLFSNVSEASSVELATSLSAFPALMLPCATLDLRRAGRNPRFGQSAMSTLAPGTDDSKTCSSSQPTSIGGEGHGAERVAEFLLMATASCCSDYWCMLVIKRAAAKHAHWKTLRAGTLTSLQPCSGGKIVSMLYRDSARHVPAELSGTHICRLDFCAVGQLDSLAAFEPPEQGPLGHSQGSRLVRQKAARGI